MMNMNISVYQAFI